LAQVDTLRDVANPTPSPRPSPAAGPRRFLRGCLIGLGALMTAITVLILGLWLAVRTAPAEYAPMTEPAAIDRSAIRAEDELVRLRNWIAATLATEARRGANRTPRTPVEQAGESFTLTLSDTDLTALGLKWARLDGYEQQYQQYLTNPTLRFTNGGVVLAGTSAAGPVLSIRFGLGLEGEQLRVRLESLRAGRMPIPKAIIGQVRERMMEEIAARSRQWKLDARLDARGLGNTAFTLAVAARLAQAVLSDQPTDSALMIPIDDRRSLPVRITALTSDAGTLTVTLNVVPFERRSQLRP
jgi:hypothetical protein